MYYFGKGSYDCRFKNKKPNMTSFLNLVKFYYTLEEKKCFKQQQPAQLYNKWTALQN